MNGPNELLRREIRGRDTLSHPCTLIEIAAGYYAIVKERGMKCSECIHRAM